MAYDSKIIDFFDTRESIAFEGQVFRATRQNLDPLAPSTSGGRWMIPDRTPVLYTCTSREGAIAEISFHWGLLSPPPSKAAMLHEIALSTTKTARIKIEDFPALGISPDQFGERNYTRSQEIGAAAAFLGLDGLLVPSARSASENLILFAENHGFDNSLRLVSSETINLNLRK